MIRAHGLERARGSLLLLAGEAGIGKSRLAEETVDLARARGARTGWGAAWPGDGVPPLWPWVQALRQLDLPTAALDSASVESPGASAAARFEQLESVAGQLRDLARTDALVVVIEDLHWADTASIRVLAFAASALRDSRCLLLGTYRSGELGGEELASLAAAGTTVAVPRLAPAAAAELLRASVGADVSRGAVDAVVARSGGNPLFVWEFGQLMAQTGRLDVAPAAVPGAVAAVIERRLARLSEDDVALLRAAAVAGTPFSSALVAAVGGVPVEEAEAVLHRGAAIGVVSRSDDSAGFAFSHDLVARSCWGAGSPPDSHACTCAPPTCSKVVWQTIPRFTWSLPTTSTMRVPSTRRRRRCIGSRLHEEPS